MCRCDTEQCESVTVKSGIGACIQVFSDDLREEQCSSTSTVSSVCLLRVVEDVHRFVTKHWRRCTDGRKRGLCLN